MLLALSKNAASLLIANIAYWLHFFISLQKCGNSPILGDVPKVGYFRNIPDEFKIKSLYSNDLILNIASKSKEAVQKLKFLDSPCGCRILRNDKKLEDGSARIGLLQ